MSKRDRIRKRIRVAKLKAARQAEKQRQADDNHVSLNVGKAVVDVRGYGEKGDSEKDDG
jgi:hypothetical protein